MNDVIVDLMTVIEWLAAQKTPTGPVEEALNRLREVKRRDGSVTAFAIPE